MSNTTPDDPFAFLFDQTIVDRHYRVSISVTRTDPDPTIQINLCSRIGAYDEPGPTTTFFLGLNSAEELGRALLMAVNATEECSG